VDCRLMTGVTALYVYDRATLLQAGARREEPEVRFTGAVCHEANPHPEVLQLFHAQGLDFDCVSRGEIEHLLATLPHIDRSPHSLHPNFIVAMSTCGLRAGGAGDRSAGVRDRDLAEGICRQGPFVRMTARGRGIIATCAPAGNTPSRRPSASSMRWPNPSGCRSAVVACTRTAAVAFRGHQLEQDRRVAHRAGAPLPGCEGRGCGRRVGCSGARGRPNRSGEARCRAGPHQQAHPTCPSGWSRPLPVAQAGVSWPG